MAANVTVRAEVVDVRVGRLPAIASGVFIDTNVWVWLANAIPASQPYQGTHYPNAISSLLRARNPLWHSPLQLAELSHLIENRARTVHARVLGREIFPKEFRHNFPSERQNVVDAVEAAWQTVEGASSALTQTLDASAAQRALARFGTECLDGYDLFLIEAALEQSLQYILTDDSDYACVAGIRLLTANDKVICAARQQSKLISL